MSDSRHAVNEPAPRSAAASATYLQRFERALARLEAASPVARAPLQPQALDAARRVLLEEGGCALLTPLAPRFEAAGLFDGTDWQEPSHLVPQLVERTLEGGEERTVVLECLSELRLLALARGESQHPGVPPEQARHFLTQVLALNLGRIFGSGASEAERTRLGPMDAAVARVFRFLLEAIGYDDILGSLIDEVWRILDQRPLRVDHVKAMVTQVATAVADGELELGPTGLGADRLVSALFRPTRGCEDDPGVAAYLERLGAMDVAALEGEGRGFARAMHDTGLVSDYHPVLLRHLVDEGHEELLPAALGLGQVGVQALRSERRLVQALIREIADPRLAQAIYGLSKLLERGLLFQTSIPPGLWQQMQMEPTPSASAALTAGVVGADGWTGGAGGLEPRVQLLAGVVALLGQPLGVGQGRNPTCQSARALSMWALSDPDYLLDLVAQVAQTDSLTMTFEGQRMQSGELPDGLASGPLRDTDPVSTLLVPHLDRVYTEMGRQCAARGEDPHRWVNPEFHGWWVGRGFAIAVDVASGKLQGYEDFLRRFFGDYHPDWNGDTQVIHPQPAGLAITDSTGAFVGWHAITLLRVAQDQDGEMRFFFYNPNNDSGQHWGDGVVVSTHGHGERHGEGSLPFHQLASRLYIYHYDPATSSSGAQVPAAEIERVEAMARRTWAAAR